MDVSPLTPEERAGLDALAADLGRVFGPRLKTLAAYGLNGAVADARDLHTVALVERLTFADLTACAPLAAGWNRRGLPVPLLLEHDEFLRTLDVFPIEYAEILADHMVLAGSDPLPSVRVAPKDVRRACELQAKSHLIHLREGYLETAGDPQAVARLVAASAPAFRTLLVSIAQLAGEQGDTIEEAAERQIGVQGSVVREVLAAGAGTGGSIAEPTALLARYITVVERIWEYLDTWRQQ